MDKSSNNYYLESIKSKIKRLDLKRTQYEVQIVEQNKFLDHNSLSIQKLKFTNDILHEQYSSLLGLVEKQGIVFQISLGKYKPHQWENLLMVKSPEGYEIRTKTGSILMVQDENFSRIIQDINKKDTYSLIVIRVTDKSALVQLRFK